MIYYVSGSERGITIYSSGTSIHITNYVESRNAQTYLRHIDDCSCTIASRVAVQRACRHESQYTAQARIDRITLCSAKYLLFRPISEDIDSTQLAPYKLITSPLVLSAMHFAFSPLSPSSSGIAPHQRQELRHKPNMTFSYISRYSLPNSSGSSKHNG